MHFIWGLAAAFFWMSPTVAADFAHRGGPEPANIEAVSKQLNADPFDMELLISFGTSKGGSADRHPRMQLRYDSFFAR
jgi:hypothetical protein